MNRAVKQPAVPKSVDTSNLWDQFSGQLMGYIQKHVPHAEDAREILQEVFVKIHTRKATLKEEHKLAAWIFKMTKNTIIDFYRKSKNRHKYQLLSTGADIFQDPYQPMIPCLKPFLLHLDQADQELIQRVDLNGESQKAIAEELGIPYSTLKTKVQNARKKLKQHFLDCCAIEMDASGRLVEMESEKVPCAACA